MLRSWVTSAFKSMNEGREFGFFSGFGLQHLYPDVGGLCRYHDRVREHGGKDKGTKYYEDS
jgi:hypothetical protein